MKQAIYIDKASLQLQVPREDGSFETVLNQSLLDNLVALNVKDLYLYSDIGEADFKTDKKGETNHTKLVALLSKQGFKVQVVTPADTLYSEPGQAYRENYLPALKKPDGVYKDLFLQASQGAGVIPSQRSKTTFSNFINNKPADLQSLLYLYSPNDERYDKYAQSGKHAKSAAAKIPHFDAFHVPAKKAPTPEELTQQNLFFLEQYVSIRERERDQSKSQYNSRAARAFSFFSSNLLSGKEAAVKIAAAKKCVALAKGEDVDPFTPAEYKAVFDGRLQKLVACNPVLKDKMPGLDPAKVEKPGQGIS